MLTDPFLKAHHVLVATNGSDLGIGYLMCPHRRLWGGITHCAWEKKTYQSLFDSVELTG